MTYTLTLTPYLAAMLDAACRSTGLDTLNLFPSVLNRSGSTAHTGTPTEPTEHPAPVATAQPELALSYEPTPAPAGSLGILARAARLNQPQAYPHPHTP